MYLYEVFINGSRINYYSSETEIKGETSEFYFTQYYYIGEYNTQEEMLELMLKDGNLEKSTIEYLMRMIGEPIPGLEMDDGPAILQLNETRKAELIKIRLPWYDEIRKKYNITLSGQSEKEGPNLNSEVC